MTQEPEHSIDYNQFWAESIQDGLFVLQRDEAGNEVRTKMTQTVAVDFDGVIHAYSKGWHDGSIYDGPLPGAIQGLKVLQSRYAVFVFTSRDVIEVWRWLRARGVLAVPDAPEDVWRGDEPVPSEAGWPPPPYPAVFWNSQDVVLVTNRKLPAVAYIDDRAVRFTDWASVPRQLEPEPEYHVIEFRDDGWTIMHPLACRPNLFDCPVNRASELGWDANSVPARGRWRVDLIDGGKLALGEKQP